MKGHADGWVPEVPFGAAAASWCDARVQRPAAVERSLTREGARGRSRCTGAARLVRAVRRLVDRAVDEILLGEQRVTSAAEARRLLAGEEKSEALAGDVQRVVALAVPVAELARGARVFKAPVGDGRLDERIGRVRRPHRGEGDQALSSLLAYRLEQSTGAPSDPELVKKLAVDLYLNPKRTPRLGRRQAALCPAHAEMASERRVRAQDGEALDASARCRRADRHRGCRFAVGGAEAAQRPLTDAGVLAGRNYGEPLPRRHAKGVGAHAPTPSCAALPRQLFVSRRVRRRAVASRGMRLRPGRR